MPLLAPPPRCHGDTPSVVEGSEASHEFSKKKHVGPVSLDGLYALGNLHQTTCSERFENEHCAGEDARAGARWRGHDAWWSRRFDESGGMRPVSLLFDDEAEERK